MKKTIIYLGLLLLFSVTALQSKAQQDQRIQAAYMLSFGRTPTSSELTYWVSRGSLTISQLIGFNRQGLTQYTDLHRQTIIKSYADALGRKPSEAEIKYWISGTDTYTELTNKHLQFLRSSDWENEKVIRLSYATTFHRVPNDGEVRFWKGIGVTPFYLLVGYHEDYQRKNRSEVGSGGKVNLIGVTSVVTVSLSAAVAAEAKIISGNGSAIISQDGASAISHDGGSIVASGAGNIVTNATGN